MKLIGFRVTEQKAKQTPKPPQKTAASKARKPSVQKAVSAAPKPAAPRGKKRRRNPFAVLMPLLLLIVLVFTAQHILGKQPDAGLRYVGDIPVHEDFLAEGTAARTGEKRDIMYVVIHETDNINQGANASRHNQFIHSNGVSNELSWHYTVDDTEIWHHLPDDETAYHAGDRMEEGGGNKNGIGVEMCVNADGDYEKTLQNAQKLAASLLYAYELPIQALRKHEDFSGKCCPSKLIQTGRWDEFTEAVNTELLLLREQDQATPQ